MNYEELRRYIYDLQQGGFDVVRLRVQLQKKIAFPLITLVMAVLAVPFALSGGRRGALSGVVVALVIGVTYVLTSSLFEAMGNVSQLPPLDRRLVARPDLRPGRRLHDHENAVIALIAEIAGIAKSAGIGDAVFPTPEIATIVPCRDPAPNRNYRPFASRPRSFLGSLLRIFFC